MAAEWRETTLDQLGRVVTGKTPPSSGPEHFGGDIPFVTPTDLDGRRVIESTGRYLTEQAADSVSGSRIPRRAVMVSCIGSDMGKAAIAGRECVTNQQINSILVESGDDPLFVYYNLSTRKAEIRAAAGGSAQPILNKSAFGRLDILLPPRDEQRAIAGILGALDDKVELNQRTNETLEAMARAIFKSWFVDFEPVRAKAEGRNPNLPKPLADLFPSYFKDSELGEIPEGWGVGSIYNIADVVYGAPFSSAKFNSDRIGEGLIRIRDLASEEPGIWTLEVHPKGYKVRPGDVIVGMDGEFRAYVWGGVEAWLNQRVCVFVPKGEASAAFVLNSIREPLAGVEATETATTVIHLGKSDIDRFSVMVPSAPILAMFGQSCQPCYDSIVVRKAECRALALLRDALLPELISGALRVRDAERFIGKAL